MLVRQGALRVARVALLLPSPSLRAVAWALPGTPSASAVRLAKCAACSALSVSCTSKPMILRL
jgi:hypothetical protein